MRLRFSFFFAVLVASTSVRAEIGDDLIREICDPRNPSNQCLPDQLEIAFGGLRSSPILELDRFEAGQLIEAAVVLDVTTDHVRGYSLGVTHDADVLELDRDSFSFVGTPVESIPNGFRQVRAVEGGLTVAALPSLSGPDPIVLPLERTALLRMRYRLRSDPGTQGTKLQFNSELGQPTTTVVLTYDLLTFPPLGRGIPPDQEVDCQNDLDDDGDGQVDRDDPDCTQRDSASGIPTMVIDGLIRLTEPEATFLRGDCNADGRINIADGIALLVANFSGGAPPLCRAACDANGDGESNSTSDAIWIFTYRFGSGPPPAAPFPACEAVGEGECEQRPAPCT